MRIAALLMLVLALGCAHRVASHVIPGPISAPPTGHGVSGADAHAIANEANAIAAHNKDAVKASLAEQAAINRAELRSSMRLAITLGLLIMAIGAGLAKYGATGVGSAIVVVGAVCILGGMVVTAAAPHMGAIAIAVLAIAALYFLIHHRAMFLGLRAEIAREPHKLSGHPRKLVNKLRAKFTR